MLLTLFYIVVISLVLCPIFRERETKKGLLLGYLDFVTDIVLYISLLPKKIFDSFEDMKESIDEFAYT